MATKTFKVTIGERLAAIKIFDAFKGNLSTLASLLDDVKQFTVTAEEWEKAELKKTPAADGKETWNWKETEPKEVTITGETEAYLKGEIKKKSDANEITLEDVTLISLNKKLE